MGNKVATGSPLQRGIDRKNISWPVGRPPEVLLSRDSVSNKEGGVTAATAATTNRTSSHQRNSSGNNLWIIERSPVAAGDDDGGPSAAKIVKVRRLLPDEAPPASARRSRLYSSLRNSTCSRVSGAESSDAQHSKDDEEVKIVRERARSVSPEKLKLPPVAAAAAEKEEAEDEEKEHVVLKKSTASCLWRRSKRSLRRVSLTKRRSYDVTAATAASTRNSGVLASTKLCTSTIEPLPRPNGAIFENPFVKPRENSVPSPRKAVHRTAVINDGILQNFHVEDQGSFEHRGESPCEEDLIYANDQADDSSIPFEFEASSTSSSDSGEGFDFFDETVTSFSDVDDERHEALSGDEYADLCQCSDSGEGENVMKPNYAYYRQQPQPFSYLPPPSFDRNSCRVEKRNVVRNIYCVPRATRDSGFEDGEYFPVKPASRSNLLLAPAHPAMPPPPHATFSSSGNRSRQYSSSASEYWRDDFVRRSEGDYYYDYEYEEEEEEDHQPKSTFDFMSRPVAELTAPVAPHQTRFQRDRLHTRSLGRVPKQPARARTLVVPIDVDEDPSEQKPRPKKAASHRRLMEDAGPRRAESAPIPHVPETSLGDFDVVQARHQLTFRRKVSEAGKKSPANVAAKSSSMLSRNVEIYTIIITLVKRERLRSRRLGHNRWSSRDSNSPRSTPRSSPRNSRDYSNEFDEPDSGFRDGDHKSDSNRDGEQRSSRPSDGKDQSSGRCGRDTYSQEEILSLRQENERLMVQVRALQRDLDETKRRSKEALDRQAAELMGGSAQHIARMQRMDSELIAAKEALAALRSDRKRLKAEKFELLSQMKQLYATLEDKDKELRDFIRNYEQRMQESELSIRSLAGEREVVERERWNLLKHVREESERCVQLAAQLGTKDAIVRQLQDELVKSREEKRLSNMSGGAASDVEGGVEASGGNDSNGQCPTSSSTLAGNGDVSGATDSQIPPLPSTPNGRMSSDRDSGVRGSSDRDSVGNTITGTLSDSAASQEGASGGRTSAGEPIYGECTSGGSGSSHYQAPYYCQTPTSYYSSQYYRKAAPSLLYASITSRDLSSLNVAQQGGALSRSVEHIYSAPIGPPGDARKFVKPPPLSTSKSGLSVGGVGNGGTSASKGFGLGMKGTWGSISRVFSRTKNRKPMDSTAYFEAQLQADLNSINNERHSWSPRGSMCAPTSPTSSQQFRLTSDSPSPSVYSESQSYSEKLRLLEEAQTLPLEQWRAPTIQAWLELSLGMPQYAVGVAHNVKSGKVLLELSDSDLCNGLGINQPMHRKKLRLAIEEHRCPAICAQYPKMASLGHPWVALQWLQDIGLPQFAEVFAAHLIDGRMLEHLTKREMEKYLSVSRKFHQLSLFHAIHLLRMVQYDVQILNDRRQGCDGVEFRDPLVWTNQRFIDWVRSIDLGEYAENLRESGVHGALVVLEESFTGDTMASALGIPNSKTIIRRHLAAELEALVNPARLTLEDEIKRAKTERRRADKLSLGGSLGRNFSRSYAGGLQESNSKEKDKENSRSRTSLRGSISKAFGMRGSKQGDLNGPPSGLSRMQNDSEVEPELGDLSPNDDSLCSSPSEACLGGNNPPGDIRDANGHLLLRQLSNDGGVSSPSTCHPPPPPPPPPPSNITGQRNPHQKHRRGKSISETDSDSLLTVTPV